MIVWPTQNSCKIWKRKETLDLFVAVFIRRIKPSCFYAQSTAFQTKLLRHYCKIWFVLSMNLLEAMLFLSLHPFLWYPLKIVRHLLIATMQKPLFANFESNFYKTKQAKLSFICPNASAESSCQIELQKSFHFCCGQSCKRLVEIIFMLWRIGFTSHNGFPHRTPHVDFMKTAHWSCGSLILCSFYCANFLWNKRANFWARME